MLKSFLKEVAQASYFVVDAFNDTIKLRGRILTPSEAETIALSTSLMISQISEVGGKRLEDLRDLSDKLKSDNVDQDSIDEATKFISKLKPQQITAMADQQSKVICQVIQNASMDSGDNWEDIRIVPNLEQQDPDNNVLWVGMLSQEDRAIILEKALQGHREAVERLKCFR